MAQRQQQQVGQLEAMADQLIGGTGAFAGDDCFCMKQVPLASIAGMDPSRVCDCAVIRDARDPFDVISSRDEDGE